MKGKLIIHLGPPKTATTSLQNYWSEFNKSGFKYLGVIQPSRMVSIATKLYNYINSDTDKENIKQELIDSIDDVLIKNKYVVISEEMLVLESSSISYVQKLKKLYKIINRFGPIITYCVRDADQVYFSFYLEIFKSLPRNIQNSFIAFQESSYSDCYKFKRIHTNLSKIGFKTINFFPFDNLVQGTLAMNEILGVDDSDYSFKVRLEKKNVTKNKNIDFRVRQKNILEELIAKASNIFPSNLRGNGIANFLIKKVKRNTTKKIEKKKISKKSRNEYLNDLNFIISLKRKKHIDHGQN